MDTLSAIWTVTVGVLLVILGFNALILVHEFGHFIVARLCGVRCEKFYIWFDFWGLKFYKFKWGDTEYGVGFFPLGGYVKMLGQEDDPGAIRQEIERAKLQAEAAAEPQSKENGELRPSIFAPDSYLSKSVLQRLAIIVAGVVMNFLFAIVCAAGAYMIGVQEATPTIGNVIPGSPAWEAGLQRDDIITHIDGKPTRAFGDIKTKMVEGLEPVQLTIDRNGETLVIPVVPRKRPGDLIPNVGVVPLQTLEFFSDKVPEHWKKYYSAETLATIAKHSEAQPLRIEKVDGEVVASFAEYQDAQLKKIGKPITCTVSGMDTELPAIPMREIPVRFEMGTIVSVLPGSDAAKQGIVPGDTIVAMYGKTDIDPLRLPQILLQKVNDGQKTVELVVKKASGEEQSLTVELAPIRSLSELGGLSMRDPLGSNALGLSWSVEPVIAAVDETKLSEGQPLPAPGDKVVSVEFINCASPFTRGVSFSKTTQEGYSIFGIGSKIDIPYIFTLLLQDAVPSMPGFWAGRMIDWGFREQEKGEKFLSVRLALESPDGNVKLVSMPILEAEDWFQTERGIGLNVDMSVFQASGLGEALKLGTDKMVFYSFLVYRSLHALIKGTVSPRALNGPVGIVEILYRIAQSGWSEYLMLLCLIGANLAVINLLPIPPLDGGHILFLTYEGIFRRQPNEMVQVILSYFGLFLILLLMIWTVALDLTCIPRW